MSQFLELRIVEVNKPVRPMTGKPSNMLPLCAEIYALPHASVNIESIGNGSSLSGPSTSAVAGRESAISSMQHCNFQSVSNDIIRLS
jgi:hypothetical protein